MQSDAWLSFWCLWDYTTHLFGVHKTYQCKVTSYWALFTTLMTRVSPFLTSKVGPGNCPFTVIMLWVLHSLFTGFSWTCSKPNNQLLIMLKWSRREKKKTKITAKKKSYNKVMVVNFGVGHWCSNSEEKAKPRKKIRAPRPKSVASLHLC